MKLNIERAWSDAMALLRGHAELLLPIFGLFAFLPALAIALLMPMEVQGDGSFEQMVAVFETYFSANLHWIVLAGLFAAFAAATVLVVLAGRGQPTVGQAMGRALALTPSLYLFSILANIAIGMGLVLLIAPGLYLLGRLALGKVHMAVEGRMNPIWAFGATWHTTRGNGWRIAFVLILIFVVGSIAGMAAGAVLGVVAGLLGGAEAAQTTNIVVTTLVGTVTSLIMLLVQLAAYRQLSAAPAAEASNGI